jgi:MFS transporter, PAT family, beta-lactamase induction signal transducer AmpG
VLSQSRSLRCLTFFYLYFMQGFPAGFALTALANYLLAEGQSALTVGRFIAVVGLPWAVQFVWGPLIDRFQTAAMGRRRPWVLASQVLALLAAVSLLLVSNPVEQLGLLSACFFIHSVFASVQDASVDAMAITVTPPRERGRVNACMRGGMLIGSSLGAALTALSIRSLGFTQTVWLQWLLLLTLTILTFLIRERESDAFFSIRRTGHRPAPGSAEAEPTLLALFRKLFSALFSPVSRRTFGSIALVYVCLSVFIRTFNVHLIQELHWSDTYLSSLSSSYLVVGALGVIFMGGMLADKLGPRKLLMGTMVLIGSFLLGFNLLFPFWENQSVSTGGLLLWYTFDPSFSIAAMPLLMNLCRKGIEGSQFTNYMSLVNCCEVAGAYLSGYALQWLPAWGIGLLCGLGLFIALITFRHWLRAENPG